MQSVPGVHQQSAGKKLTRKQNEGRLEREKGRERVPSLSPQSPLVFSLVFPAYDLTRSLPSELRALLYELLCGRGYPSCDIQSEKIQAWYQQDDKSQLELNLYVSALKEIVSRCYKQCEHQNKADDVLATVTVRKITSWGIFVVVHLSFAYRD